jgi:flagellar biosynthesis protein FlhG
MESDHYAALGLEPGATPEQIERAYRFCLELYGETSVATYSLLEPHEAEAQRARVREAYEVLVNVERRRAYDEARGHQPPAAESSFPAPLPLAAQAATPVEVSGPELRRRRESLGISLRHVAAVSKVGVRFLEYIEQERFEMLPPPVYLRGFLQEYARVVRLDPREVAERYLARMA